MLRAARAVQARLPHGWMDLCRQLALCALAYEAYRLAHGLVVGRVATAFENARDVISLERTLHVFVEPGVQAWTMSRGLIMTVVDFLYVNAQSAMLAAVLLFLYLFRNHAFYLVRNMLLMAMAIALVCYVAFPTAPPRMFPEWGFADPVAHFVGVAGHQGAVDVLVNPFAAIPSMHVAFALMLAWPMVGEVRRRWAKVAWALYPLLIAYVVVATGNHFWTDVVLGAFTAGLAYRLTTLAQMLSRRPTLAEAPA